MSGRELSLTRDPIPGLTWRIALPASVGMLFNTLFNFVDTLCAGWLGTEALAALMLSFAPFFLLIAVGSGLAQGTTALIANSLGQKNPAQARHLFAQSVVLAAVIGMIFSLAGLVTAPSLFRLLGADGDYLTSALAYMNVIFLGSPLFMLAMALNSALAAQGENRPYRNFLIVGFIANCVFNPLLMWGVPGVMPGLGIAGIGMATILIQGGGCIYLWRCVSQVGLMHLLPAHLWKPDFLKIKQLAGQSFPAALNMMTIAAGVFVLTWFVQHFGQTAMAATGIAVRIEQIILMPAIGLSSALISLVGQNHGAGLAQRVREAWWTNVKCGVGLMVLGGFILGFGGQFLVQYFTADAGVAAEGEKYLRVAALTLPAYPILFATIFMMQGLKRPAFGLWIGIYRQILAPLLVCHALAFSWGLGLVGVWWGVFFVAWSAASFSFWWAWRILHTNQCPTQPFPNHSLPGASNP
jgi:putative MATE family efflux protein